MATDYGYDVSCMTGLRTGRMVSGVRLVAEAVYRRLTTPRGTLLGGEDEANYGLDLAGMLGSAVTPGAIAALPGRIENELLKDERIESVTVEVTSTQAGPAVSWSVTASAVTGLGPFTLVLGVEGVSARLLKLEADS